MHKTIRNVSGNTVLSTIEKFDSEPDISKLMEQWNCWDFEFFLFQEIAQVMTLPYLMMKIYYEKLQNKTKMMILSDNILTKTK